MGINSIYCYSYIAEWVAAVFSQRCHLPSQLTQFDWLHEWERTLQKQGRYKEKYHYLGENDDQWEYCRFLASESGLMNNTIPVVGKCISVCISYMYMFYYSISFIYDVYIVHNISSCTTTTTDTTTTTTSWSAYIDLLQSIYDDATLHRSTEPGAPDCYRQRHYHIHWSVPCPILGFYTIFLMS